MKKITIEQIDEGWLIQTIAGEDGEPVAQISPFSFTTFGATDSSSKSLLGFVRDYFEQGQ